MEASSLTPTFSPTVRTFKSSTPRKRKNALENLESNLSPKYIGTPIGTMLKDTGRALRRRQLRANSSLPQADHVESDSAEATDSNSRSQSNSPVPVSALAMTPTQFVSCVRRTRVSPQPAPTMQEHHKVFVSPIDKLLISNGSTVPLICASGSQTPDVSWFTTERNSDNVEDLITKHVIDTQPIVKEDSGNCDKSETTLEGEVETNSLQVECYNCTTDAINRDAEIAHSPSTYSLDSARGSSVVNSDSTWTTDFGAGDICWGQIYAYCYWPCIVCPDPEGKTISTVGARHRERHVVAHVRFFADHGRRNWVKRENLMPFRGLDAYKQHMQEVRERHGNKHAKYKVLVPQRAKLRYWYQAIAEAEDVQGVSIEQRLRKFHDIQQQSRELLKEQKRKRLLTHTVKCEINDDYEEGQKDESSQCEPSWSEVAGMLKRERSESPFSPVYSPIKYPAAKRARLSSGEEFQPQMHRKGILTEGVENNREFKKFFATMRDFVLENNADEMLENSLAVAVRNIWALKHISHTQMQQRLLESMDVPSLGSSLIERSNGSTNETVSVKRLSNRLKFLTLPRSLAITPPQQIDVTTTPLMPLVAKDTKPKKLLNRPIEEVIEDILRLDSKYLFKGLFRDPVCKYCHKPDGKLVKCVRNCQTWLHAACRDIPPEQLELNKSVGKKAKRNRGRPSPQVISIHKTADTTKEEEEEKLQQIADEILCRECENDEVPKCGVCQTSTPITDLNLDEQMPLVCCSMPQCSRHFHEVCCKYWPQAKFIKSKCIVEYFRCPSHVCHTCVSDDPKGKFQHLSNAKLTRCVKCPASYHTDSTCIPAGSQILTAAYIVCPRHHMAKNDQQVNVSWCFICVGGGQVVCCETCPTAVHAACLKIPLDANEGYICEECESGRMPLYGELVWAKFNSFRWWPALILPPSEVPANIQRRAHNVHDFVVRFFGTHDHGWISRRRVYLFVEGDCGEPPRSKSHLDKNYQRGVLEAKRIYELIKQRKHALRLQQGTERKEKLQPQPYVKIKSNRVVPPLKIRAVDIEEVSKCECDPHDKQPCGPDSNCLNRVLYHECNPKLCAAGSRCQNQMFESRISPRLDVIYMKERGFGLVCREPIAAGSFVIEYVGELINDEEFAERLAQKSRDRDENFYFLSLEKDHIIDAGPKGNLARFMNHSCEPNCETQKWTVNGNNRVGIFTIKDIPENTELTFNYLWDDLLGNEKKPCFCGAPKCAGQIGGKTKATEDKDKDKVNHIYF